jgi:hypothetical protein
MMQELREIVHNATVPLVEECVPLPAPLTEAERERVQNALRAQLKIVAAKGESTFELVYATTRHFRPDLDCHPEVSRNEAICAFPYEIDNSHVCRKNAISVNYAHECEWCKKQKATSTVTQSAKFGEILSLPDDAFYFSVPTCSFHVCESLARVCATQKVTVRMCKIGYTPEPTVMQVPSAGSQEPTAHVSPYCPVPLARWLAEHAHEELGCELPTHKTEDLAALRFGTVLQDYVQQHIVWPELDMRVACSRVRPAGPKDAATISHHVDHGLFLDWSDNVAESASKKSKTSE